MLILPDEYSKNNTFPVYLKNDDGDVESECLMTNDNIWLINKRSKTYDLWIAQQVFVSFCVNMTQVVELIIHLKLAKFLREVIIQEQKMAI